MRTIDSSPQHVSAAYAKVRRNIEVVRQRLGRPLTLTDKIMLGHLDDADAADLAPGESYIQLRPDQISRLRW